MSLKRFKEKCAKNNSKQPNFINKNLKTITTLVISGLSIIIIIMFYIYYSDSVKEENTITMEKITKTYQDAQKTNNPNELKNVLTQGENLLKKITNNKQKSILLVYLANISLELKNPNQSIKYNEDLIKICEDEQIIIQAKYNIGISYEELNNYNKAIENYLNALSVKKPNFLSKEINLSLARCYEKTGRIEEAKSIYKTMPESEVATNRLSSLN